MSQRHSPKLSPVLLAATVASLLALPPATFARSLPPIDALAQVPVTAAASTAGAGKGAAFSIDPRYGVPTFLP
ncbi:MAG: hypothetical protein ABIO63_11245, partial [Casimicrobiaceae bacterium]